MTYSIVHLSEVKKARRLDAEYFKTEYMKIERKRDEHRHLRQKHDLQDIADAFKTWAKEQGLSFWS